MTRQQPADPFEDELRRVLDDEATEPAPERLVARVATIPREVRPDRAPLARVRGAVRGSRTGRFGLGLVVAGAVVAVAVMAFLGGQASPPTVGGPTPSGVVSASPSAPEAQASASPSEASSGQPSAGPGGGPAGGPVPAGFQPASVTFVSADLGWVLGSATCAGSPCAAIVRTADGGRTWAGIPAPTATLAPDPGGSSSGVSRIRFADARDGWAFGPDLWATHDGGATWQPVALPGATGGSQVMALETAAGVVHAAYADPANAGIRIATSPVGSESWAGSPTVLPIGAGPVPEAQLVLQGTAGWLLENDRVVVGGARLVAGAWGTWGPPCTDVAGPATLAATSERDVVAACDVGLWSTPQGVHVYASADGGASFAEGGTPPPIHGVDVVAAPDPSTIVIGGRLPVGDAALVASFDAGRTWAEVERLPGAGSFSELGFTTAAQGVAIAISTGGDAPVGALIMTHDGGRTWSSVAIAGS